MNLIEDQESIASERLAFDHHVDQNLTIVAVLCDHEGTEPYCMLGYLKIGRIMWSDKCEEERKETIPVQVPATETCFMTKDGIV